MSSAILSEKLKKILPNKRTFVILIFLLFSLTLTSIVVLANENTVIVEAEILNVRYGPGLAHDVLTQVEEKERLHVLGEENKWYKVRLKNDQIGWVASWLVDNNKLVNKDSYFVRVVAPAVNIRQFANTESTILGVVHENTELQVLYKDDAWYQILYMGQVAWIHGDYTEKIEQAPKPEVIPASDSVVKTGNQQTNVRSAPSLESEIIHLAAANTNFDYIETVNGWYHVQVEENKTGYIAESVATLEDRMIAESVEDNLKVDQPIAKASSLSEATIVIDAGHGGKDPGAISADQSIYEKNLSLNTALLLKNRLEDAGANVILTRKQDVFISLDERVAISHQYHADAFISLHYDAMEQANMMSGTTTYYQDKADKELAETINQYLKVNGSLPNNGVRLAEYQVLRENRQPAILLELGYMNHMRDTQIIDTPFYQSTIVEAIYQALGEYYGQ